MILGLIVAMEVLKVIDCSFSDCRSCTESLKWSLIPQKALQAIDEVLTYFHDVKRKIQIHLAGKVCRGFG